MPYRTLDPYGHATLAHHEGGTVCPSRRPSLRYCRSYDIEGYLVEIDGTQAIQPMS